MLHDIIQLQQNNISMVDMFCGAGIGAIGFKKAGFNIIDAFDIKKYAVDTYNRNIGNHARILDAKKIKTGDLPYADIYVGGFPCQPFSVGGSMNGTNDKKLGDLGYHFSRIIIENQPKVFIAENVSGIVSNKNKSFFDYLVSVFNDGYYNVEWKIIDCYNYGVPQNRKRMFMVGVRKDINKIFTFPQEYLPENKKTLRDAIFDIQGNINIKNNINHYSGGFSSRYITANRQRQWDEPSYTIVSEARQLPLHPEPPNYDVRLTQINMPRRLNVRECLRIQTVPDEFYFEDNISLDKQHERCSGIPSYFAYILGQEIYSQIFK